MLIGAIREIWHPHITIQEDHFGIERLAEMVPAEEHAQLSGEMAQLSMEDAEPIYLVVPFALYNLSPDQRDVLSQKMPPEVIEELVPVAWQEKWAPMKPFLLT